MTIDLIVPSASAHRDSGDADWISLPGLLRDRARLSPNKIAFEYVGTVAEQRDQITFAELEQEAGRIAAEVRLIQENEGQPVLLVYPADLEFIAAFLGCLMAGAVPAAAPLSPTPAGKARLEAILSSSKARLALANSAHVGRLSRLLANSQASHGLRWLATDDISGESALDVGGGSLSPASLAYLQYSSGSTGRPKGVMITHGATMANLRTMRQAFRTQPTEISVSWLPHYHDMGLVAGILYPVFEGITGVLMSPATFLRQPEFWLRTISSTGATLSGGPNFGYEHCIRSIDSIDRTSLDLSHWTVAISGAEPVRADTINRFADSFGRCGFNRRAFYPTYGLAEATLMVSGGDRDENPKVMALDSDALAQSRVTLANDRTARVREVVSCGRPRLLVQLVDPTTGRPVEEGSVGEIIVSGPSVAQGYFNDPQSTNETFGSGVADCAGATVKTGDLGFLHGGDLYIVGRAKDLIIIRGRNIHPSDVETTVQRADKRFHSNGGAAVSLDVDEEERLYFVQEVDAAGSELENLIELIRDTIWLGHGIDVHGILLIRPGALPKTSSGKVQRFACKTAIERGNFDTLLEWRRT
jgi:acyl-CoA synthetase (AMP-forming)/AMP-acid ligase II